MTDKETRWAPVVGFEGKYEVSDVGDVRGVLRIVGAANGKTKIIQPKLLRSYRVNSGHLYVDLYWKRSRTKKGVHVLVLEAFAGIAPEGHEGCHRNGNPADNRTQNLYWGTRSDNLRDAVAHGTHSNAAKTHCPQEHPYDETNTYSRPNGGRGCRACLSQQKMAYKKKQREGAK